MTEPTTVAYTFANLTTFNSAEYFEEYDWFERVPLDDGGRSEFYSKYQNGQYDFGQGFKTYEFSKYVVCDTEKVEPNIVFLVANEVLSEEELDRLVQHCQCRACTHSILKTWQLPPCACCVGCLRTDLTRKDVIKKTRKYMSDHSLDQVSDLKTSSFFSSYFY